MKPTYSALLEGCSSIGVDLSVISEKNYLRYVDCAFRMLDELVTLIFDAYKNKKYRYNL
ncbi:hypothetical protein GA0061081_10848 [Gilliamella bombicola]|uniref:Uncharacterized protein n=1 Tax=Gilliamella bombicola TaxID=1798182 RepID=A0A1C4CD02_9GAMM|nr:hypothetical protein GA0061081_10848 [Gilliamella bombicola]